MYDGLKVLHVLGVVLFLGNVTTGLFWHAHAARSRDPRLLAHAMEGIIRSDRIFTIPGVLVIVASGLGAAVAGGYPILGTSWILWSIVLFTLSGAAFSARVAPLQRRLLAFASEAAARGALDWQGYRRLALEWELWGAAALLTPVAALVLMILKPG